MDVRRLSEGFAASPQIRPEDCATIAAMGFGIIVNNRPDAEVTAPLDGASIEAAAQQAGLGYLAIPVDHSGFSAEQVAAMSACLAHQKPVFAYCRSGTRSTLLWALAQASRGAKVDDCVAAAAAAGYDVSGLVPLMRQLGGL